MSISEVSSSLLVHSTLYTAKQISIKLKSYEWDSLKHSKELMYVSWNSTTEHFIAITIL